MSREKNISVQRSNYSVIDNEFNNMRGHFDNEMRRMEDEMNRLRGEFDNYRPGSSFHDHNALERQQIAPARPRYHPQLDQIKSPLITDDSDQKTLRLRFDVAQYRPEEVTVKTVDNKLLVYAKHEEKSPTKSCYREYNQEFLLPRGTNPELITSSLSTDGVLTVTAPLPALEGPQPKPITHR